jgi:hypothetical protein
MHKPTNFIVRLLNPSIYAVRPGEKVMWCDGINLATYPVLAEATPHDDFEKFDCFGIDRYCTIHKPELMRLFNSANNSLNWVNNPASSDNPNVKREAWEMVADVSPSNPFAHWNRLKSIGLH